MGVFLSYVTARGHALIDRELYLPLDWCEDADREVRHAAVQALLDNNEDIPVDAILHSLDNREVRTVAIDILSALESKAPVEPLLTALIDENGRHTEFFVIERWQADPAFNYTKFGMASENDYIRRKATQSLIALGANIPVDAVTAMLKTAREVVRLCAVEILGSCGEAAPVEALTGMLRDSSPQVRKAAALALRKFGQKVQIDPLLSALYDQKLDVSMAVAKTLVNLGEQGKNSLQKSLQSDNPKIRLTSAAALGKLGPIEPLLEALNIQDEEAMVVALEGLAEHKEAVPVEPLLNIWYEMRENMWSYYSLCEQVEHLLTTLGKPVAEALISTLSAQQKVTRKVMALELLEKFCDYIPTELLVSMLDTNKNTEIHKRLVKVFARKLTLLSNHESIDILLKALHRSEALIRIAAIEALGNRKGATSTSIGALVTVLHDESPQVRIAACKAFYDLGDLGDLAPWKQLIDALADPDLIIYMLVGQVLRQQGKRAVEPLIAALNIDDTFIRERVLMCLAYLHEWTPEDIWIAVLHDKDERVSDTAILILVALGKPTFMEPLKALLAERDKTFMSLLMRSLLGEEDAKKELLTSLEKFDGDDLVFLTTMKTLVETFDELRENSELRLRLLSAIIGTLIPGTLGRISLQALEAIGVHVPIKLIELALHDKNGEVREQAMQILGQVAQKAPADFLLNCLADSNSQVRHAAIDILKKTHPEALFSVEPEAVAALSDQEPAGILGSIAQRTFVEFIKEMKSPTPYLFQALKECLSWPHWEVRMKAAQALGKLRRNIPDDVVKWLEKLQRDSESQAVREVANEALANILSFESFEDD